MNLKLQHAVIRVTSITRAKEFYIQKLGMEVLEETKNFFAAKAGGVRLSFFEGYEKAEKGELSPAVKNQYDAAVIRNATIDNEYKTRKAELVAARDRSKGTSAAPAPAPTKTELPPGAIPGSKQIGTSKGVPVYEAPDGRRYTLTPAK